MAGMARAAACMLATVGRSTYGKHPGKYSNSSLRGLRPSSLAAPTVRMARSVLQRVSFPAPGGETVGTLHIPGVETVGAVAVLHDLGADAEVPQAVAVAEALANSGIGALRFRFRSLGGQPTLDAALAETAAALRLLKAHPALTGAIGLVGFGFGGAVAGIAAGRDSRVRVAVLAGAPAEVGGSRRPLAELSRTRAKVLIAWGDRDTEVTFAEVERYGAVLSQARVTHRIARIEGADHEFAPAGPRERFVAEVAAWVRESF
jgi:alpha/beta superfamily hydrolase